MEELCSFQKKTHYFKNIYIEMDKEYKVEWKKLSEIPMYVTE